MGPRLGGRNLPDDAFAEGHPVRLRGARARAEVDYAGREIGNAALANHLLTRQRGLVIVAAHSSGSFVAHELFAELAAMEASGPTLLGRTVYYDLDGGESGLTPEIVVGYGGRTSSMRRTAPPAPCRPTPPR